MDPQPDFFSDSKAAVENYVQYKLHLVKLQAVEKISKLSAAMFAGIVIVVLSFFIVLFLSIMAAWYFGHLLGSPFKGFGIISAFYFLVLVLILIFRKKVLERTITNSVINIIFEKPHEEHDDANPSN
jgi:ABC-type sugar transport system permease subunit